MGLGYSFYCAKCKFTQNFYLGVGRQSYQNPKTFLEEVVKEKICNGVYGEKFRIHLEKYPTSLQKVSNNILLCDCGYMWNEWSFSLDILYEKYNPEESLLEKPALIYRSKPICKKCTSFTQISEHNFPVWIRCSKCAANIKRGKMPLLWD